MHRVLQALALALLAAATAVADLEVGSVTGTEPLASDLRATVPCNDGYDSLPETCRPDACKRIVVDGMVSDEDADSLRRLTNQAIAFVTKQAGVELTEDWGEEPHPPKLLDGPTIVDINTGFVRHSRLGLRMLYKPHPKRPRDPVFIPDAGARDVYRRVGEALESRLRDEFGLTSLHFTAPTFVARLQGADGWTPRDAHDEYWHPHVDRVSHGRGQEARPALRKRVRSPSAGWVAYGGWRRFRRAMPRPRSLAALSPATAPRPTSQNNTAHYHYSALLYLSTGDGDDFQGGEFQFMDAAGNATVLPRKGRAVLFSAGQENLHRVRPVVAGVRYAISMWFTCDESRKMPLFLDGSTHQKFQGRKRRIQRHREGRAEL